MGFFLYALIVVLSAACAYFLGLLNGALYIPTDARTVEAMLDRAGMKPGDSLVDLGSGDGRLVIAAAKRGTPAHGYEINPILVWLTNRKIRMERLEALASVSWKDFWSADLSGYSVVTVFGIAHIMHRLERKLDRELAPGTLVVSHLFPLPNWKGEKKEGVYIYRKP